MILKVICTIFDIGAQKDPYIFQTLNVLLFFHLSQKKRGSHFMIQEPILRAALCYPAERSLTTPKNTL